MALRRLVLRTSRFAPLRSLYLAFYRLHVWLAKSLALRFRGTRAMYLAAGMGRGEIRPGISDIDTVIFGDWDPETQIRLLKCLAVLVLLMPLFDRESLGAIQTWQEFLQLNDTDLFMAYHYSSSKQNWRLIWGEDLIQGLPPLQPARRGGASHIELRRWWATYAKVAYGNGVTARDAVFRNSMSFKAVADVLRAEIMAFGQVPPPTRKQILQQALHQPDAVLQHRLLASEADDFLTMEGDPRLFVAPWLLHRLEHLNRTLAATESFSALASARIEGTAAERLIAPATAAHAARLAQSAQKHPGFKAAYLAPCAVFFSPDSLGVFLEFDPAHLPSSDELRELLAFHFKEHAQLPQRLLVYLLLDNAAYVLESSYGLEIWSWMLVPQANPDLFSLLSRDEFLLCGTSRSPEQDLRWSHVSQELLEEELSVRRAAHQRFGALARPSPADNLRNLWRLLQLVVMKRRVMGEMVIPVTVAATSRAVAQHAPDRAADLDTLHDAMMAFLEGRSPDVDAAIQRTYDWLVSCDFALPGSPATNAASRADGTTGS
jgi:hypothetical protein